MAAGKVAQMLVLVPHEAAAVPDAAPEIFMYEGVCL